LAIEVSMACWNAGLRAGGGIEAGSRVDPGIVMPGIVIEGDGYRKGCSSRGWWARRSDSSASRKDVDPPRVQDFWYWVLPRRNRIRSIGRTARTRRVVEIFAGASQAECV